MNKPSQIENKGVSEPSEGNIQCWGCEGPHSYRDCPFNNYVCKTIHNIQDSTIINGLS